VREISAFGATGPAFGGMERGVKPQSRDLSASLRTNDALIARWDALAFGLSVTQIHGYLEKGTWERIHRGVYRATSAPRTERQLIRAACLAAGAGATASHRSAAWLWGLVERPPGWPEITVTTAWAPRLQRVRVHRSGDLDGTRRILRYGIPTTTPLRTLVDLGAVVAAPTLTEVVDRALATRLVTLEALTAEMNRLSRRGRRGPGRLRDVLGERGLIGAPSPSVLESRMLRVIVAHKLPVPAVEVIVGPDGDYRLDFAYLEIKLAMEVDGYSWHFTPEQLQRDHERRNKLQNNGWRVLVFTWLDVTRRPHMVAAAIHEARRKLGALTKSAPTAPPPIAAGGR
jgi:hypothetical protein